MTRERREERMRADETTQDPSRERARIERGREEEENEGTERGGPRRQQGGREHEEVKVCKDERKEHKRATCRILKRQMLVSHGADCTP